jgi:enolase
LIQEEILLEVDVITDNGVLGRAAVPSHQLASMKQRIRDGGKAYLRKGVLNAVKNVNTLSLRTCRCF